MNDDQPMPMEGQSVHLAGEFFKLREEVARLERELAREKLRAEENGKLAHNLGIELEQARKDAKQSDLDAIRALGERNDARKELAAERELADRLACALQDIEGRASDESVALHPDADAKAFVDDCWEWSEQALAAYKAARIDAHLDECVAKSAESWKPLPGDPDVFYPPHQ